ncbi:MAG: GNAT family N-acetyltransferase [Candidatus Thorarchaeota archaeon]|nr:MAG: GNAT family N-acetyltransferase [Candidatus Thorarchaeota archaeon]
MKRDENGVYPAEVEDLEAVLKLLQLVGLPTEDVETHFENFMIWQDSETMKILGCVGLEIYDDGMLMRSVAVHPSSRGRRIGKKLVDASLMKAKALGATSVYLLTDTAENYFKRLGFSLVAREDVPNGVKESIEFTKLCIGAPSMKKDLDEKK